MKEKIFAAIMTLVVLALTTNLWLTYKGKITFFTDLKPKMEILLQYRQENTDSLISVTKKSKPDGRVIFEVEGKAVNYFKINLPEKTTIQKVQFQGKNISLTEKNEYTGKSLKGIFSHSCIFIVFFSFFSFLFMFNAIKNGHHPKEEEKLPKIMNVEFLRILFTLGIVCVHFFEKINLYTSGGYGVEFFFILSGFLFALTFSPERKTIEFAKSKFIRWMPLIIFGGFIRRPNFSSIFYPLFFLQNTGLAYRDIANQTAWYLAVLFWVLIFYLSVFKAMKCEIRNLFIGTLTFLSYIICARVGCGDRWNMVYSYFPIGLLRGIAGVGLGCMLQQICVRKENTVIKKSATVFEIIALLYIILDIFVMPMAKEWIFKPVFYFIILYLFVKKEGFISNFFEKPVFAKMARYCLSIYLTHQYVTSNVFFVYEEKLAQYSPAVTVICVLTTSILLGIFAHHIIEKPTTKALKKWMG